MTEQNKIQKELNDKMSAREDQQIEEVKQKLAKSISQTYLNWKTEQKMNQHIFAAIIGSSQPRVSNIINGKVSSFTIDKLFGFCVRLEITSNLQSKPLKIMKSETRKLVDIIKNNEAA